jgi:hypothetical protein
MTTWTAPEAAFMKFFIDTADLADLAPDVKERKAAE